MDIRGVFGGYIKYNQHVIKSMVLAVVFYK